MKTMGAALAKTHFLALLDQVEMKRGDQPHQGKR
jgi:hypothetical protein